MEQRYCIDTLTLEQFKRFFRSGNHDKCRQIRVSTEGEIYWSYIFVGMQNLEGVACRFETIEPVSSVNQDSGIFGDEVMRTLHDPYVIEDSELERMYNTLMRNWKKGCPRKYIDYWE